MTVKEGIDRMDEYFRPSKNAAWRLIGNPYKKKREVDLDEYDSFDEQVDCLDDGTILDDPL